MGYIEETTLLAFKPFLFNTRVSTLHPFTLPDYVWPSHKVITSPCGWHTEPENGCTCGVYSTIDIEEVDRFVSCTIDTQVSELLPLMGVVQVLGKTLVEDLTLRSWGAYLWGIVYPPSIKRPWFLEFVLYPIYELDFNPVAYDNISDATQDVNQTLKNYGLEVL
jgi:hypothetical protein